MNFEADFKEFNSPSFLLECIPLVQFDSKFLNSYNIFTHNGNNYQFKNLFYSQQKLRGGGCCIKNSRPQPYRIITVQKIPQFFSQHMIEHSKIIESKALSVQNKPDKQLVISSIQWFIKNQEHFNTLCLDQQQGSKFLNTIQISLDLILKSTLNYVTTSGYLCIELFSICNLLVRVLYSYYSFFKKKMLNQKFREGLENYLTEFENAVKTNATQCWEFGIDFELEIMNIALAHISTKSENPKNITLGIIQSFAKFEISDKLIQSIFEYVKEILKKFVGKLKNPIEKYEVYCTLESMKWNIIQQITQRGQIHNIKIELQNLYIQFIKNSQDWILHYCWIKMISDILTYRPIVDINILLQSIKPSERSKKWKDLIKDECIEQLPYNNNQAQCICFPKKSNVFQRSQFLREFSEIGLAELAEFQQELMNLDKQPDQQLWLFYIIYKQQNEKENELKQQNLQIQSLFNFIPIFQQLLDYLKNLFEKNQIIIQKTNKLIQNLQNEQEGAELNYQFEFLDQNTKIQTNTIEMIYVINEINLHIILMIYKLIFITESLIMQDKTQLTDIVKSIKDHYELRFVYCLNLLPKELIEFLKTKFNWEDTLQNHFNRNNIFNPFNTINQKSFDELRQLSEQILETVKQYKFIFEDQVYSEKLNRNEFISLNQFQHIFEYSVEHFFPKFLDEVTNNISKILNSVHDVQKDKRQLYLYKSIHVSLKISRFLLFIMQVRFYKNQPYQVMEELSSRRQGTLEDEIKNSTDDIKILVQKQKEQILKALIEDSKEQKDLSLVSLTDLVKCNINQIKKMQINGDIDKKNILKQMAIIQLELMKLVDFYDNEFQKQLDFIIATHQNIFQILDQQNHLDQQQSQRQRDNESFNRQQYLEPLSNNFDSIATNLTNLLEKIEFIIDSFELKFKIESDQDQDLENRAAQTRKEISKQIEQVFNNLTQNNTQFSKNLKQLFLDLAANYDTQQIPYIDIYQFLEILQIFDIKDFHTQQPFQDLSNDNQAYLNLVQFYKNLRQFDYDTQNQQQDEQKIKQCLCYNLIKINSIILEENLQTFSKKLIITIWIKEKDHKVRQLLQNEELIEIQNQLYSRNSEGFQQEVELNVKKSLQDFDEYHNQILQEEDDEKKQQLKIKLQDIEKDLDQYLLNISDMQVKLQINITTLIELRKEFNNVKQNLLKLEQKMDDANLRIARLIGKKYEELLEIRRKNYLDRMNKNELEELYVEQQFTLVNSYEEQDSNLELNNLIRSFMKDQQPLVMLVYGRSGVGKTTALNKIEQFIWKNQMLVDNIKIIPISASLADLKTPTINLFKEILMQDKYGFNENQIREFKEALTQTNQQVLFLLDSYDEMSNQFKYQNLYISNRFSDFYNSNNNRNAIKLIIFCRKEFIKQQQYVQKQQNLNGSQYQTWFRFKNMLREAELLELDNLQITNFLEQYTKLSILQEIQNFQDKVFKQFEYNQISFFESQNDWKNLLSIIEEAKTQSEKSLLNQHQLDEIINYLKGKNQFLKQNQNYINQMKILRENLQKLWSLEKYQSFINDLQIEEIMKIPHLSKLILEVLPKLDQNFSDKQKNFIQNYYEVKQTSILSNKITPIINSPNSYTQTDQLGWQKILKSYQVEIKGEIEKNIKNFQNTGLFQKVLNNRLIDFDLNTNLRQFNIDSQEAQLIINALKQKQITIYDFLDMLSQAYQEKQIQTLKLKGKIQDEDNFKQDVFLFAESLSLEMIQNQDLSIQYKPQGQLQIFQKFSTCNEENWYDRYFHDKDINNEYFSLIRSAMLITQRGDNFSFCHEKIPQFYAAKSIYNLINILKLQDNTQVNFFEEEHFENNSTKLKKQIEIIKQSWLNQVKFNLSQVQYKEVFQILKEKVIKDKSFKEKLIMLIQVSADYDMIQAASNSISVLGFMTKDLSNMSLKGIQLQNTSLIGIDFSNSDLSNSSFHQVNISDCNFTGSNLNDAQWSNIINYNLQRIINNCCSLFQFQQNQQVVIYKTDTKFYQLELESGKEAREIFSNSTALNCFDISNDGQKLAYTEMDCCDIWVGKFIEMDKKILLKEHQNIVDKLSFSKQNELLASGGRDNKIIIWNWQKGLKIGSIDIQGKNLCNIVFSYHNKYIALHFTDEFIQLRYGESWKSKKNIRELSDRVTVFAFSFDQMIASVQQTEKKSQVIQLINLQQKEKERQLKGHKDKINYLLFLSDKKSLISGGDDCFIILWNYQTGELKGRVQTYPQKILFLNISTNNRILGYYNQNNSIKFLDLEAFQSIHQLKHPSKQINQILFSKDDLILVSFNQSKNITLWDMREGKKMKKIINYHQDQVISIAFTQDGQFLASASLDNKIIIQNFQDYSIKWKCTTNAPIKKMKFSKDDKYLAYLCEQDDSQIILIPWKKEGERRKFKRIKIQDFCFSIDTKILIFLENSIYDWNYLNQSERPKLQKQIDSIIKYFAFSTCGHYFAFSDDKNQIKLYDLKKGDVQLLKLTCNDVKCIIFLSNQDVKYLAIGEKEKIQFYNLQTKKIEFSISVDYQQDIQILAFSPNGFLLASVLQDKTIKIYDIQKKQLIFTLPQPCSIHLQQKDFERPIIKNYLNENLLQR